MKQLLQLCFTFLLPFTLFAQTSTTFSGLVVNESEETLIGATVNWKNTTTGAVTDIDGWFTIERLDTINPYILEISYVGYETVEVEILPEEQNLKLVVEANATLEDIVVESRQRSTFTSTLDPLNVENIGEGELRRAACCNLSESFENNATVNVHFADAVTGAKEIEMLGLRGIYTQMMIENRPTFNRLGRAYGLEYIPGTFIEAIQISKGASTVKKGVQGITGQINTELIKPHKAPLLFLNLYANYTGRLELNAQFNYRLSKEWSTGLLMHGNYFGTEIDYNNDSFLDIPRKQQANVISRWMYKPKNLHFEINLQGIWDDRRGGQTFNSYQKTFGTTATRLYQVNSNVRRVGVFGKLGYFGFDNPNKSVAIIYDANIHQHNSYFGDKTYTGLQKRLYLNFVYQTNIVNKMHNLSTGFAYDVVDFKEQFVDINNDRTEHLGSLYAEYDFSKTFNEEKGNAFAILLGIRTDLIHTQNFTKFYPAPRMNIKYNFTSDIVLRASGGRGVRTPNLFVENLKYMPSYKDFSILETILPEVAWNYGLNFAWNFRISPKLEGSLSIDAYRTDFENQLVVDLDSDPTYNAIQFYNLKGKSFSNSILVSYTQDIVKGLEARVAYKFIDARMTYGSILHEMPLMPRHRGLVHLNYTTPKKDWEFNVTMNIVGSQRLPHLHPPYGPDELPAYRYTEYSPTYVTLNAHIAKFFKGGWEVYIGGENITNYTQDQPILGYQDPFGTSTTTTYAKFDATSVYAPVFGAQVYAGVKYTFQGKDRFPPATSCSASSVVDVAPKTASETFPMEDFHHRIKIKTSAQCGMCETKINKALFDVEGVDFVALNLETQLVEVIYVANKTTPQALRQAISQAGYDADELPSNANTYANLPACCTKEEGHKAGMKSTTFTTVEIKTSNQCGMCSTKISDALYALKGVENVRVDQENQTVMVQFIEKQTNLKKIQQAISKTGYDADDLKANKAAYNKLPGCCKKPADR